MKNHRETRDKLSRNPEEINYKIGLTLLTILVILLSYVAFTN